MTSFKPLGFSVSILLFLGLVVPFLLSPFLDVSNISPSPMVDPLVNLIEYDPVLDVLLVEIHFNPFSWIGARFRSFLTESLSFSGFYPDWFVGIVLILSLLAFIYTIVTIVRGN